MSTTFVSPTSTVESFKNQRLGQINTGLGVNVQAPASAGLGIGAQQRLQAGRPQQRAMDSLQALKGTATRQHDLRLAAIRNSRAKMTQNSGGGGYSYQGSYGGGGGGKYNFVGSYRLNPGADAALQPLMAAFRNHFGYDLQILSGGRSYEDQVEAVRKYGLGRAAAPGTSPHESGRAVDFGGGMQNANSREHIWMQQNAHRWGWKWTGKNFSVFEPWHWEFMG